MQRLPLLLITALALLLTGCGTTGHPEFASSSAHIAEASDQGTVVAIEIHTLNRGDDPLPLTRIEYTVDIDGKPAAVGLRSAQCTAHRFSEQSFTVPAVVPGNVKPSTYRITGTVTYVPAELVYRVLYDEEIHRPSQSFTFEGQIAAEAPVVPVHAAPELTSPPPRPPEDDKSKSK